MKALARAPADRHKTAAAFAGALSATPAAATERVPARRRKGMWMGVAAGAVLVIAIAAGVLRSRPKAVPVLDASLVAVAPFDVLDPKLELWREGLVDLLSRNLDGAGPLRTVSPTVVIRRWRGRADPVSAGDLGRNTGAGLALYGSLLGAGPDSVRLRATLLDVKQGSALEEWDLGGYADRMDRLTDSLTLSVLRGLGRTRPIGSVRLAGFGSTSLPAIKAFLQGEQHLRRSEWDSALTYYERAIRLDNSFAIALRRASTALGWIRTGFDSVSTAYAFRAGASNRGLPPRDSLFVASDSLLASLFEAGPFALGADSGWGSRLQRLFATLDQATSSYPDDPEAWYLKGDAYAHFGAFAGRPYEQERQAFDRAIALDSAYAPSYLHPIEFSANDGPEEMQRYLRPYLALAPKDVNADGLRLVAAVLDPATTSGAATNFAGVPGDGLFAAFLALVRLPDTAESAVQIARFMVSRSWPEPPLSNPVVARRQLERILLSRGHFREWHRVTQEAPAPLMLSEAALLGAVPVETAAASFLERLSGPVGPHLVGAFPWWAVRRDTLSLRKAAARAASLAQRGSRNGPLEAYVSASAEAYLALTRGDSIQALKRFLALPRGGCPACYLDQVTTAQLLVEQKDDGRAWQLLQSDLPNATLPSAILWSLLRGRVAERIGEREIAAQSYAWVAGMWRNADPELQPYATEAREGLARLSSERK
jgi:eukaryotic-like serine/threonine-protein kinase